MTQEDSAHEAGHATVEDYIQYLNLGLIPNVYPDLIDAFEAALTPAQLKTYHDGLAAHARATAEEYGAFD